MSAASNYLENKVLDHVLRNTAYTQPGNLYIGLFKNNSLTNLEAGTLTDEVATAGGTLYARKAVTFGTATTADPSVISNSASPSSFTISGAGGTVAGAFLCTVASGTSGVLFSESDFQAPGDRVVVSGDTLNVTYTFSLDAA